MSIINGQFATRAIVFGAPTFDGLLQQNGVTDTKLLDQGHATGFSLQWLDTLSPSQLDEVTLGNPSEGTRITTYGDLKVFKTLEQGLSDYEASFAAAGTPVGVDSLDWSHANGADIQFAQVSAALAGLENNLPGSVTTATSTLQQLQQQGHLADISGAQAGALFHQAEAEKPAWEQTDGATLAQVTAGGGDTALLATLSPSDTAPAIAPPPAFPAAAAKLPVAKQDQSSIALAILQQSQPAKTALLSLFT